MRFFRDDDLQGGIMPKISVATNVSLPMPVVIVGTVDNGLANYMAVAWISRVNGNPPLIAISLGKARHTNSLIEKSKEFSVNFPSIRDVVRTDYVGMVSGGKVSKAEVFQSSYGRLKKAPLITDCPLSIACSLYKKVPLPTHDMFIGEVVEVFAEDAFMHESAFKFMEAGSFLLTMPDNAYWGIGMKVGNAWNAGRAYEGNS
jgi:flavin reductase (DIM6/NTAB) family NADH-FMN oxidoreductase RutF